MPKVGEIVERKKIGQKFNYKYIWIACSDCGEERWVYLCKNLPIRCQNCANRELAKIRNKGVLDSSTIYRKVVEEKLGRKLKEGEHVHHIDMDNTNNDLGNLYVYKSNSGHGNGHASINKLIASLLKDNILEFKDGIYYRKK